MAIKVVPTVTIDGRPVACTADRLDVEPVVIAGFNIDWGRNEYGNPSTSPASLALTITDATGEWATAIRTTRAVGLPVLVTWRLTLDPGGVPGPRSRCLGPHPKARAVPMDDRTTTDGRRRWRVRATVADRTADYGNGLAGPAPWDSETMLSRAVKVRDLGVAAGSGIEHVYFWPPIRARHCPRLTSRANPA